MNKTRRLLIFPFITFLISIFNGCAVNPVSGNREIVLMSVEDEIKVGAENNQMVEEQIGFIDDPALLKYVQAIGNRLAKYSPYQEVKYQFQIVDSADPNAFALPGGYVYVSRGLLVLVNSEDELAGVIGHEIGHVAARHAVQRLTRAAPIGLVTGITSAAAGIVSPSLASAVSGTGNLLNSAVLAPYSREQENDADEIGQGLASTAGWGPEGIAIFLNTLGREATRHGAGGDQVSFLSTHPSTPDRVKATEKRAKELTRKTPNPIAGTHDEFMEKFNGLIVGPDAKGGVFVEQQFLQPTMNFALTFPADWETTNQPQYVAAVTKQQDALLILQLQSKGNDPIYAAKSFLQDANLSRQQVERLTISGLPAGRTVLNNMGQEAVLYWIAFEDQIYRLTGVSKHTGAGHRSVFETAANSFHELSKEERKKIHQQRLRLIRANQGESLDALLKRSGSDWEVEACAIANNLQSTVRLTKGQLVKVSIAEPFK